MLRPVGDDGRVVKIGFTRSDPFIRLAALQTGSPLPLLIWAYMRGDVALERALHNAFAPLRSHGEWFFIDGKLRAFMQVIAPEEPVGRIVHPDVLSIAISDYVMSPFVPHDSITDQEWPSSAKPEALARHFPDEWASSILDGAQ